MISVRQVLPDEREADLRALLEELNDSQVQMPFHASRQDFVVDFARRLRRAGRTSPQLSALAHWMRRSEVHRLSLAFADLGGPNLILRPRGTVFHIPPSNVDTMFVYSWVLSLLTGNRNIIRLPSQLTDQMATILDVARETLVDHPAVAQSTAVLRYGHDDAVSRAISAAADVRVIWGGDRTVTTIRSIPLPPHATELTFADRVSIAAIHAPSYDMLTDSAKCELADRFFRDTFFFDQLGCSSPRLLVWVGTSDDAAPDFRKRLRATIAQRGYQVPPAVAIAKLGRACASAIDGEAVAIDLAGAALTVISARDYPDLHAQYPGGGLLYELCVDQLSDIAPHVDRRVQTLAAFGLSGKELAGFTESLAGSGIDRVVPIGKALHFDRYWDGYDQLAEFTRKVTLDVEESM